jgi:hypothetical protein
MLSLRPLCVGGTSAHLVARGSNHKADHLRTAGERPSETPVFTPGDPSHELVPHLGAPRITQPVKTGERAGMWAERARAMQHPGRMAPRGKACKI